MAKQRAPSAAGGLVATAQALPSAAEAAEPSGRLGVVGQEIMALGFDVVSPWVDRASINKEAMDIHGPRKPMLEWLGELDKHVREKE